MCPNLDKNDVLCRRKQGYVMELTSIDYARLLSWMAYYKHNVLLNKTQMQKLLYMCYGMYYALEGKPMFKDDTPKAWPYGPVFPRVNVRYNPYSIPSGLTPEEKNNYLQDKTALKIADGVVRKYAHIPAKELSEWSHEKDGPWFNTVYGKEGNKQDVKWNREIPGEEIKEYFKQWLKN